MDDASVGHRLTPDVGAVRQSGKHVGVLLAARHPPVGWRRRRRSGRRVARIPVRRQRPFQIPLRRPVANVKINSGRHTRQKQMTKERERQDRQTDLV